MQRRNENRVRPVRSVNYLLHGIFVAAPGVAAEFACLYLVGVGFVRFALLDGDGGAAAACQPRLDAGYTGAAAAEDMRGVGRGGVHGHKVGYAETRRAGIAYRLRQLARRFAPDVVMLPAIAAERYLNRRGVLPQRRPVQRHPVFAAFVNQKRAFQRAREQMPSARRAAVGLRQRLAEDNRVCRKRLAEKRGCELRHLVSRRLRLSRSDGGAGGDAVERADAPALGYAPFQAAHQHAHLSAARAPVQMRLVKHDKSPMPPALK